MEGCVKPGVADVTALVNTWREGGLERSLPWQAFWGAPWGSHLGEHTEIPNSHSVPLETSAATHVEGYLGSPH